MFTDNILVNILCVIVLGEIFIYLFKNLLSKDSIDQAIGNTVRNGLLFTVFLATGIHQCGNKSEESPEPIHTADYYQVNKHGNSSWNDGAVHTYATKAQRFMEAAEQGDAAAQYALGECYYRGDGVDLSFEEAEKWYRKSAEQGCAPAQFKLGNLYMSERATMKEGADWYTKAAEQGYATAQLHLGKCFLYGNGVSENQGTAIKWLRLAAQQNNKEAQRLLKGRGVSY